MTFTLDPRLEADTHPVTEMSLCRVLLSRDANYPWAILVPQVDGAADLIDLDTADRAMLALEVDAVSRALKSLTNCDKLNVAALGNMVRQLHIHVIARFEGDAAWPGPVWGKVEATDYAGDEAELFAAKLAAAVRSEIT
ncbi:HIT domain-containing protein [Tepidamorphus sp. 3E244]|uniref:HIT domain-containing protein n=1 Tax=Tepidamorphus sp. 3E244 TaxID=3385498 RepID=UPI0038FC9F89